MCHQPMVSQQFKRVLVFECAAKLLPIPILRPIFTRHLRIEADSVATLKQFCVCMHSAGDRHSSMTLWNALQLVQTLSCILCQPSLLYGHGQRAAATNC